MNNNIYILRIKMAFNSTIFLQKHTKKEKKKSKYTVAVKYVAALRMNA